ncbi:uncharacterized protein LY89DRAFT_681569 [Mollisia scopiformis]|uniref:DUF3074 domain-containing protein n=1 Tax=Mollisia scopiformis TaxID=149040 RepID=A0A194XME2_MOLSC|nr:uncharacterized protein LY89DRAFT_681569 [Mollisia scopiformis]KUJ20937.1 hypothetical protein LY89DRAFT_681569 [Mollisia scopiformis]
MAALHDALKTLGPIDFTETPLDDLKPFLTHAFSHGQLIVDSVPIPAPADDSGALDGRSRASSTASNASEISVSSARSDPPPSDVEALQKEWKQVKMNPRDNPLGMNVYKLGGKDGKGAWFARRSVHEGLGFTKWKKALELEFPETMKVQGGPGEGNIRGIGGERRVAYKDIEGVGKVEVYLLSAQFPGPTTPRDFVTMFITSDQALSDHTGGEKEVPRHFMVLSRPCSHPDTPPRDGFIRGYYESVEFIREIPIKKPPKKSASTTNLPSQSGRQRSASTLSRDVMLRNARKHSPPESENGSPTPETEATQSEGRARGHTISFDKSRGSDAKGESMDVPKEEDDCETNPIEWIMITRSDPGGSVPRFMIERGTPNGIVQDASKFLNWACAKDMDDFESDGEEEDDSSTVEGDERDELARKHDHKHHHGQVSLHNYQTNGHLAGIEEAETPKSEVPPPTYPEAADQHTNGGLYGAALGAATAAAGYIASHTPQVITDHLSGQVNPYPGNQETSPRRESVSSIESASSVGSFASALENNDSTQNLGENDGSSLKSSQTTSSLAVNRTLAAQDKELQKLEEKKKKIDEKLNKAREKEISKKSEDKEKEEEALKKAEEKHKLEVKKQEEKYRKEVEKLEKKKEKEEKKAEERKKKTAEKDERTKMLRELEELKAEVGVLRKEKEILRGQVGDLQAENTALAARVGRLGIQGEEVLKDVRAEVNRTGRSRASSLKAMAIRPSNFVRSSTSLDKEENAVPAVETGNGST